MSSLVPSLVRCCAVLRSRARGLASTSVFVGLSACSGSDPESLPSQREEIAVDAGPPSKDAASDAGRAKDAASGRDAKASASVDAGEDGQSCGSVRAAAQLQRGPVDIVLALDTSGSMAGQICNVSTNLTALAAGVGDDAHVVGVYDMGVLGVATALLCGNADPLAATPLAMDPKRYLHRAVNVDSWNALTELVDEFDSYRDFLHPDATTNFIVVTDDQSDPLRGGMLAADFKMQMEQKLGHAFIFHAIVADGENGCFGSNIGTEYLTLADQTHGEKLPICATDWTALFMQLQAAVASSAPIPCDFEIPPSPAGGTLDTAAVQVVFKPESDPEQQFPRASGVDKCKDEAAWYYNDPAAPTRVQLCPAACEAVKRGGDINIAFGCAPLMVL